MKIKFCGAARAVTGSCHLLTLDSGFTILLDCGLYQGRDDALKEFNDNWEFDPAKLDCLILSHAHIDHSGRVPKLYKDGFRGEIFCTHATRSLAGIMMLDSAKIQQRDAEYHNKKGHGQQEPLYSKKHVKNVMNQFTGLSYDRWHYVTKNVRLLFRDAGHILGSANVTLEIKKENGEVVLFGFTGDIGRPNRPILRDPVPMPEVDYLICESTYGNRDHLSPPAEMEQFLEVIKKTCVEKKGKLLIPAFSIGRTQEIVYMLDQLETARKLPKIPIFVDSPLAIDATHVFGSHPECYDEELNEYLLVDNNPFGFKDLQYVRESWASKKLNNYKGPCIIISSSGMINAGRIKHHVFNSIDNPDNSILIVGYCSPRTPGGALRRGDRHIYLFGHKMEVNMEVFTMDSFSAHADRNEMVDFLANQNSLKKLFLVHGDYDTQFEFKQYLNRFGIKNIEIPSLAQEFEIN